MSQLSNFCGIEAGGREEATIVERERDELQFAPLGQMLLAWKEGLGKDSLTALFSENGICMGGGCLCELCGKHT